MASMYITNNNIHKAMNYVWLLNLIGSLFYNIITEKYLLDSVLYFFLPEIKRNMVCVYRLLRPDEIYANVIQAKNPNSLTSVFRHVTGGGWGPTSRYISTCGSLQALRDFASRSMRSPADIIKIKIDTLPENVEIIISETTPKG